MNQRFIVFRRSGVFYCEDTTTGKQTSLRTKDEAEANILLHAKNEATRQPVLNLQIARAYAKKAQVVISTLEDYERRAAAASAIVPLPLPAACAS